MVIIFDVSFHHLMELVVAFSDTVCPSEYECALHLLFRTTACPNQSNPILAKIKKA